MTGKNPGKHAIYDFFRPRAGTYQLEFVNGDRDVDLLSAGLQWRF